MLSCGVKQGYFETVWRTLAQWNFLSYIANVVRFEAMEVRIYRWIQIILDSSCYIRIRCSSTGKSYIFKSTSQTCRRFDPAPGILLFWVIFCKFPNFGIQITNFRKHSQTGDLYLLIVEFIKKLLFLELIYVLLRALWENWVWKSHFYEVNFVQIEVVGSNPRLA